MTVQTADPHPCKPHPAALKAAPAETGVAAEGAATIGNTTFDMQMAGNAGVAASGAAWRYHPTEQLVPCGASIIALRGDGHELSLAIERYLQ